MRLPFRNYLSTPMTIFIEPYCDEYEVPPGGEAMVTMDDGHPHSIDIHPDQWISIWDEGAEPAVVEVISEEEKCIDHALMFVRVWLHRLGAEDSVDAIEESITQLEPGAGYLRARAMVFGAFYKGFRAKEIAKELSGSNQAEGLSAAFLAGELAAELNSDARHKNSFPELGAAPFDTDTVHSAFDQAAKVAARLETPA